MSSTVDKKDEATILGEFYKDSSKTDKLVVSINKYQGEQYVHIRWHFKPEGGEQYYPTKKGVTLNVYHLNKLKSAIEKAINTVKGSK